MMLLLQVQVFYGRGDVRLLDHDKVYQVITELIKEGKPEADVSTFSHDRCGDFNRPAFLGSPGPVLTSP